MRLRSQVIAMLLGVVATVALNSCAVGRTIARDGLVTDSAPKQGYHRFTTAPGQSIVGCTTVDGIHHVLEGRAWIEGDSMVFERPAKNQGMEKPQPAMRFRVALADLTSVDAIEISPVRSVLLVAGLAVVTYGVFVAGALASMSGPLLGGFEGW